MKPVENKIKILIMAGGTGGHIFPALSIANYLIEKGVAVEWLGTKNGMESRVISETNIPIHYISVSGLRGKSIIKKILSPLVVVIAISQAIYKLLRIKPNCVLGMGGFVTGPGGIAAWLLRKKLCIHEQNAIAGFSNQMLAPFSNVVMEAFQGAFIRKSELTSNKMFIPRIDKNKIINVGNPVRTDIINCKKIENEITKIETGNIKILILGGSLGAVAINKIIPETLALFKEEAMPEIMHQCGRNNLQTTKREYINNKIELTKTINIKEFISDMGKEYAWADLIICRSGALTVSEIAVVGVASVLVPYPYAVDDHQTENANMLEEVGAGNIIQQKDLTSNKLFEIITKYTNDNELLVNASLAAKKVSKPDATKNAAEICIKACYA